MDIPALRPGSRAECGRCGHVVTSHIVHGMQRAAAFALSALILLVVACSFPFMAFERAGLSNEMTLPSAAWALYQDGAYVLSALVVGFILTVPALLLSIMLVLAYALWRKRPWSSLPVLGRALTQVQPWSMVEVFVIGVLVSLLKLTKLATVILGVSFWAFVALMLCLTASFASIDRHELWESLDQENSV